MLWKLAQERSWAELRSRLAEEGQPAADWSEIDALCRERSVLLDCNDADRVSLLLRYGSR